MKDFNEAQTGLDRLFEKIKYDRRTGESTGENRAQRRERERRERRAKNKLPA